MDNVARGMIAHLPVFAHNMVTSGEWKGGSICRLDNALSKPSAADVACNFHLLKPLLEFSPDRVLLFDLGVWFLFLFASFTFLSPISSFCFIHMSWHSQGA